VKNEQVQVVFAGSAGELISRAVPNRYHAGDALITGSTGYRWVERELRVPGVFHSSVL
jgi:hypothetical protein